MKSKLILILLLFVTTVGCSRVQMFDGPSFRDQLSELVDMRDSGLISDKEYKMLKRGILNVMLH